MEERKNQIVEILNREGKISVEELSKRLYVCEMTIRRDLKELESEGRIKRYRGGAIGIINEADFTFNDRKLLHSEEKMKLAKRAVEYVEDGSVVFIDSSSTCAYIVPLLASKNNIKLVTNSLSALVLAVKYRIHCIMAGGNCSNGDMCTVGNYAVEMLKDINIDVAFFSSQGISEDGIISDNNLEQTAVRKSAMNNSRKNIFLFIRSKKNKRFMYTVCRTEDIFKVVETED